MASKGLVSDERARTLIGVPDVATYAEIAALAQEVIDERQNAVAHVMNGEVIAEQRLEIVALRARLEVLTRMVAETPVEKIVENVRNAKALQTSANGAGS